MKDSYEEIYNRDGHFSFGKNWQRFLETLNEARKMEAKKSLLNFLGENFEVKGKDVVDIGSGSGLFSWAFYALGAKNIVSVDIDDFSLACTKELRRQSGDPSSWNIQKISALNQEKLKTLGVFDLVYSWGALHHTGSMWQAITNSLSLVAPEGYFYIALYNKNEKKILEGTSRFWGKVKVFYNNQNTFIKNICDKMYATYICFGLLANGINPLKYAKEYKLARGMDFMTDVRDWLGGHPYEYASVEEVEDFFLKKGFRMVNVREVRSIGCNEFLFKKIS